MEKTSRRTWRARICPCCKVGTLHVIAALQGPTQMAVAAAEIVPRLAPTAQTGATLSIFTKSSTHVVAVMTDGFPGMGRQHAQDLD